jgi:ribosomal-protein-serine acetyltransferase
MFSRLIAEDAELRMLQPHHAEEFYALVDGNRQHLRRWLPWVDSITSVGMEREFIYASLAGFSRDGSFVAGIWFRGRVVGAIGLHEIAWRNKLTSIGYFLSEESQGNGLITNACRALIDHSFGDLGLNRVEIRVATENHRSLAVPRRLGFNEEGVLRQVEWLYDRYVDHVVFAMLADEWQQLAGRASDGEVG